jgi:predicted Holliday junction resolvase-like endonuclease
MVLTYVISCSSLCVCEIMSSTKELELRIKELEKQLELETKKHESSRPVREKIAQMSSEVVDYNPYR